jgi:putative Holliday junction resolvase
VEWSFPAGADLRSLGLDVGDKRIGLAVSDPLGMLARPLSLLVRSRDEADIEQILSLVKEHQIGMIIVGLPRLNSGEIGPQAQKVQQFAEQLQKASAVPLEYRDERYTTLAAKEMLGERGKKKARYEKKGDYDAAAAAVILQSYLNETRPMQYPNSEPADND